MKPLFRLFLHYLFWQRLLRWTFGAGVLLQIAAVLPYGFDEADKLKSLLAMLASLLMWLFPLLLAAVVFRQLISNPRLALLPDLRRQAALALLILVLISSLGITASISLTRFGWQWPALAASYAVLSLFLLLGQWWMSQRWGAALFWLYYILCSQIWQFAAVRSALQDPRAITLLTIVASIAWLVLFVWLKQARAIRPLSFGMAQLSQPNGDNQMAAPVGLLRLSFSGTRSAANTLLMGGYYNLKNRLLLHVFLIAAFPLMMLLIQLLPALAKGKPFMSGPGAASALLLMGLYGSFIGGFLGREWLARMRYLWLRCSGDRAALWPVLERMILRDVQLSIAVSALYAGAIWAALSVPLQHAMWFVLLSGSTLLFYLYLSQYLRLRQANMVVQALIAVLMVGVTLTVVFVSYHQNRDWPLLLFCSALLLASALLRQRTRQQFLRADWCQIRPMRIGRLGQCANR